MRENVLPRAAELANSLAPEGGDTGGSDDDGGRSFLRIEMRRALREPPLNYSLSRPAPYSTFPSGRDRPSAIPLPTFDRALTTGDRLIRAR